MSATIKLTRPRAPKCLVPQFTSLTFQKMGVTLKINIKRPTPASRQQLHMKQTQVIEKVFLRKRNSVFGNHSDVSSPLIFYLHCTLPLVLLSPSQQQKFAADNISDQNPDRNFKIIYEKEDFGNQSDTPSPFICHISTTYIHTESQANYTLRRKHDCLLT